MFGLGVSRVLSDNIAIDLGTANTLVYVAGRGVIINGNPLSLRSALAAAFAMFWR